jgi:hypothetical protein
MLSPMCVCAVGCDICKKEEMINMCKILIRKPEGKGELLIWTLK